MKTLPLILLLGIALPLAAAPEPPAAEWTESGVLEYSYAYARNWLGYRMRRDGWVCRIGFTAGRNGEQEHSVWVKGDRKMQLMIWKIDSNRTGYSKGELRDGDDRRK